MFCGIVDHSSRISLNTNCQFEHKVYIFTLLTERWLFIIDIFSLKVLELGNWNSGTCLYNGMNVRCVHISHLEYGFKYPQMSIPAQAEEVFM